MPYSLKSLTPMLETQDLQATVDFYTKTLGFTCENFVESWGWASLKKDSVMVMFALPNHHRDNPNLMSGSLYFRPDNVDAVWEQLKDKAKICYPIENFEYGMREFAIYDNNGYILQFGEPIE